MLAGDGRNDEFKERITNIATAVVIAGLALIVFTILLAIAVRAWQWIVA